MKIGSLESIINDASSTFKRFPFGIICAIAGTVCSLMLVENNSNDKQSERMLWQLIITFSLGMVASVATDLFSQRYYVRNRTQIIFNFLILVLMMVFYKTLPAEITIKAGVRIFILSLSAHLAVSFAPFLVNDEPTGFWQFNKTLFLRLLTSVLYSGVLFVGIALALLAIQNLFEVRVPDTFYFKMWVVFAGVFNTWFFLAGVPYDIPALETQQDYPRGLKIFTQYVLLPLITIYLFILYAYMLRIIITSVWPVGWVCYLVLGFSIAGILALLLVWLLRDDESNRWIKTYTRNFYFALFPLIILLFVAIGKRIAQYGITENRYFIIVLAVWLLVVALYFLVSKRKRIKTIPISLFAFVLLAGFGPLNAFNVSRTNQFNRLEKLFEQNGWLAEGKVMASNKKIPIDDQRGISSTIDYLTKTHGVESVQPLFKQNLEKLCKKDSSLYVDYTFCIMESVGLKYLSRYDSFVEPSNEKVFSFNAPEPKSFNVEGYDYFITYNYNSTNEDENHVTHQTFAVGEDSIGIEISASRKILMVIMSDSARLQLDLGALVKKQEEKGDLNQYDLKAGELTLQAENDYYRIKLVITSIGGNYKPDDKENQLNYLEGKLMIGKKVN